MKNKLTFIGAAYIIALVFLSWGFAIGKYQVFPYHILASVYSEVHAFLYRGDVVDKSLVEKTLLQPQQIWAPIKKKGLSVEDPAFNEDGIILLPRYSPTHGQAIVDLVQAKDFQVLHQWIPDIDAIIAQLPESLRQHDIRNQSKARFVVTHPYLLEDGSLVFHSGDGPLVKIDRCGSIKWVINRAFHHAIERDHQGNLVIPIKIEPVQFTNFNFNEYRDDGYAVVTTEGSILEEHSVAKILFENGFRAMLMGIGAVDSDHLHVNDADPILENNGVAKTGDIAISIRHLSTVLLYRPNVGKVVWLKNGPWLNQHDINILPDGRYSVFDNQMARVRETNPDRIVDTVFPPIRLFIFDPRTNKLEQPYRDVLNAQKVYTSQQGKATILKNGDVFIDSYNQARLMRTSADKVRWQFINSDDGRIANFINWARYYEPNELNITWTQKACSSLN